MKRLFKIGLWLILCILVVPVLAQDDAPMLPDFADLPAGEWSQLYPGDEATCLYDTEYSFFVRPADVETSKLMIYFQGGGACWNGLTCNPDSLTAAPAVEDDELNTYMAGIFDYDNEANPLRDYHAVFVPYCSGDVHTGNNIMVYDLEDGDNIQINHNGNANANSVLQWVYDNFLAPEQIFITGCSAGGYGATHHSAAIMQHYESVPAVHLADAANGVTPKPFPVYNDWGTLETLPTFIDALAEATIDTYDTSLSTIETALYFPQNRFAQFNTFFDGTQVGFYGLLSGVVINEDNFAQLGLDWANQMLTNLGRIQNSVDNFTSYTPGGSMHCILPRPEFYDYVLQGVAFTDWLEALLHGEQPDSVQCNAFLGECFAPPTAQENE